jgi:hypothetical protein
MVYFSIIMVVYFSIIIYKIYCKDRTFQVTGTLFYTYKFTKMKDFWISFL